jgi:hypothetical protein
MRWTLAKAGLAVFTASSLGLARPSLAQQSSYLPVATPTPAGKVRNDVHPYATVKQHHGMPDEIQVELAWLADPATFPCRLVANVDADHVTIKGFVPNEAVKMRAMEIAGQHTALPLIDEMRIYQNIPLPAAGVAVDSVLGDAAQVLARQLGEKANPLELTASTAGQIVVTGTLPTYADQLAVSHCLWGVHGCTSVRNLIRVPGFESTSTTNAKTSVEKPSPLPTASKTLASADAKASGPAMPSAVETKAVAPKTLTPAEAKASIPAKTTTVETKTVAPNVAMLPDVKATSATAETTPAGAGTPTGTEISRFKTLKTSKADASKDSSKDTTKETSKTIALPTTSTETAKPSQSVAVAKPSDSAKAPPVSGPTLVLPSATGSVVAPKSKANEPMVAGERKTVAPQQASSTVVAPLSESNEPIVGSERKPAAVERKLPVGDATSVITADAKMKDKPSKKVEPVSHAASAPVAKNTPAAEGAYVASGVVTYEEAAPVKPVPAKPAPAKSAPAKPAQPLDPATKALKDRIQSACGRTGKNVEVQTSPGNHLTIKVQCTTREEGERLSKQILEVPDLAPYEVSLDVKVVP